MTLSTAEFYFSHPEFIQYLFLFPNASAVPYGFLTTVALWGDKNGMGRFGSPNNLNLFLDPKKRDEEVPLTDMWAVLAPLIGQTETQRQSLVPSHVEKKW